MHIKIGGPGVVVIGLVILGWAAHEVGQALSPDAIAMALGVVFGCMASLPGALLVIFARRGEPTQTYHQPPYRAPETHVVTLPDGQHLMLSEDEYRHFYRFLSAKRERQLSQYHEVDR